MKSLYTDASFDYTHTEKTIENVVRGKIAIAGEGLEIIEKVAIGKVKGLRQYINILELVAIARAIEIAKERQFEGELKVTTDSTTAMTWARAGKIKNKKVETEAHVNAIGYLNKIKKDFGGTVTFNQVGRDFNPAGHLLAAELER